MKKFVFLLSALFISAMAYSQDGLAYWSNAEGWKFDFDADGVIDMQFPNKTADKEIAEVFVLDANGDGFFDLCEVDRTEGLIKWHFYYNNGKNNFTDTQSFEFGMSVGDKALSGDFNADGIGDIAIRRDNEWGLWWIIHFMGMAGDVNLPFGINENDALLAGDFNNDGVDDIAFYSRGAWKVAFTPDNMPTLAAADVDNMQFGTNLDIPVVGDFDGDGFADMGLCSVDDEEVSVNLHNTGKPENNGYSRNGRGSFDMTIPMPAGINPTHVRGIRKQQISTGFENNQLVSSNLSLSPNPVNSGEQVSFYAEGLESGKTYQVQVVGLSGQLVKKEVVTGADGKLVLSTSDLVQGTYFVSICIANEYVTRKLCVF